jgi:hypothetical protein
MRLYVALILTVLILHETALDARAGFRATLNPTAGSGLTPGLGTSEYVVRIDWTQNPATGGHTAQWIDQNYSSFCIEHNQSVYFGGTYQYQTHSLEGSPNPGFGTGMSADQADQIRRLWAADRRSLSTDNVKTAAFQEAIWFILDPNFLVDAVVQSQVDIYLADSKNTTYAKANLVALTNSVYQDQVVELKDGWMVNPFGEVVPTPVPPTLVLVLTGIVPLVIGRLRQRIV